MNKGQEETFRIAKTKSTRSLESEKLLPVAAEALIPQAGDAPGLGRWKMLRYRPFTASPDTTWY